MRRLLLFVVVLACGPGVAAAQTTREVTPTERSIVRVNTKLRFTTLIILPPGEQILDFVCGDSDYWVVSGAENLAYVKPAKAGAETNLNLVTSSGQVYSFLLTEGVGETDLKLYVLPSGDPTTVNGRQRFYSAPDVEALRAAADAARHELEATRASVETSVQSAIDEFRSAYPTQLRFPYRFKAGEKPFNVSAIFHDGRFTYIRADAGELPSLYEVRDGAPNLINFQVEEGVYVVPKVLEEGYLAIGRERLSFEAR